jgi:hypothetical protein
MERDDIDSGVRGTGSFGRRILAILVLWIQFSGWIYCFEYEGITKGLLAVFIPPYGWYKSIEFSYRLVTRQLPEKVQTGSHEQPSYQWPDLTAEELSVASDIVSKAMSEPLTETDIQRFKDLQKAYYQRIKVPVSVLKMQPSVSTALLELYCRYRHEYGSCLLISFDTKKPFVSEELERLVSMCRKIGAPSEMKLLADLRRLDSTAYGTAWTDETGQQFHPLTRDDILEGIERVELPKANLAKLNKALEEVVASMTK